MDTPLAEDATLHHSHADVIKRLKRVEGHVKAIVAMIESQRPCPDIAQQMHAVEAALRQAKRTFIHDHIDHCLDHHLGDDPRATLRAFKDIAKYL